MIEKYLPNKKYYEFSTDCRCGNEELEDVKKCLLKELEREEKE